MLILTSISCDDVEFSMFNRSVKYSCDHSFIRGLIYRSDAIADEPFFRDVSGYDSRRI